MILGLPSDEEFCGVSPCNGSNGFVCVTDITLAAFAHHLDAGSTLDAPDVAVLSPDAVPHSTSRGETLQGGAPNGLQATSRGHKLIICMGYYDTYVRSTYIYIYIYVYLYTLYLAQANI